MEKQILLLDIDGTLFDGATYFNKFLFPELEKKYGQEKKNELQASLKAYQATLKKSTEFDPEVWVSLASEKTAISVEELRSFVYNMDYFFGSVFPEIKPTISELFETVSLGVFSEGVLDWQNKKIDYMGLKNYFEQNLTFISKDKVSEQFMDQLPNGSIIVDDKMEYLVRLKQRGTFSPIWLNRNDEVSSLPLKQIKDLSQILGKLEEIRRESLP